MDFCGREKNNRTGVTESPHRKPRAIVDHFPFSDGLGPRHPAWTLLGMVHQPDHVPGGASAGGGGTWWTGSCRKSAYGSGHTCALDETGTAFCWGRSDYGAIGVFPVPSTVEPVQVGGGPWITIEAGVTHTCAIHQDTTLWCWGQNTSWQVGDGSRDGLPRFEPTIVCG